MSVRGKKLMALMLLFSVYAYAEAGHKITWESVEGAAGYYIEIKDSGDTIITAETITGNSYDIIRLQPGDYQFRVATVNILGQRGQSTDWIEFTVEKLLYRSLQVCPEASLWHLTPTEI
jgi:predicted phage tail protein